MEQSSNPIILYDGLCGFCNRTVQFILRHDSHDRFRFASLQSDFAHAVLTKHGLDPADLSTIYLVVDYGQPPERLFSRSRASAEVWSGLDAPWRFFGSLLRLVPTWLADPGYNLIARNRYRIFGKHTACPLPGIKDRGKFLDNGPLRS